MRNIIKTSLLGIALILGSCSEDFLETDSTEFISADKMADRGPLNPEIFNGTIRALYTLMYKTETGGTTGHDDFGQKGYDIFTDMLCGDMVLGGYNYGWYEDLAKMVSTIDYRDNNNYKPWRYYYRIIRAANSVIDGLGGNDVVLEDQDAKWQMGQAKTIRAYAYFNLANMFATDYDLTKEILPIYTSKKDENMPLSTAKAVWDLILSDLESSADLLTGYDREGIHGVNQDVANGLLAYAYLTMGEYANAVTVADKVIAKYNVIPKALTYYNTTDPANVNYRNAYSYFDGKGANWIWGMDLTLDQGLDLVSWWGQVDYYTYSYAAAGDRKVIDLGLFEKIRLDDSRRNQFHAGARLPLNKFYHEGREPMGQREITSDYVYMRVEEMHLIKAEALAFNNQDGDAVAALKVLLLERIDNLSYLDALTGQALKDEIYLQWRIEMWGEGKSYYAMKRNKATITRYGHIDFNIPIEYNDDRLTFDIPYQEIQDNPNI